MKRTSKSAPGRMSADDVLRLMAGMRQHGVACVEFEGCKLALVPDRAVGGQQTPAPRPTAALATAGIAQAKATLEQQRIARASRRAGADLGAQTGKSLTKLVEDVVDEASKPETETPIARSP